MNFELSGRETGGGLWILTLAAVIGSLQLSSIIAANEQVQVDGTLLTVAEQSDYRATSRSDEVEQLLQRLDERASHLHRSAIGVTTENRPLTAMIAANPPVTKPEQLAGDNRLVVLMIGNIHAGEVDGKEALLRLLRELALNPDHPWLKRIVFVIVPNYNPDGNDRDGKLTRPGQIGPVNGFGLRHNGQDLDLNRDFIKLECPETRALMKLIVNWTPHFFLDAHTTNGSHHRYQLTYDVPHNPAAPAGPVSLLREGLLPDVTRTLAEQKKDTFYYGNFGENHTRWFSFGDEPRYSTEYVGMRGRLAILSESYSYIPYRDRIEATHAFVTECMNYLAKHHSDVIRILNEARSNQAVKGPRNVPVAATLAAFPDKVVVKGYELPGGDIAAIPLGPVPPEAKFKDYTVDFYGRFEPTHQVPLPYAYVIPPELTTVIDQLHRHGVSIKQLRQPVQVPVEAARIQQVNFIEPAFQRHRMAKVNVQRRQESRLLDGGSLIVLTDQSISQLIVYLLEPDSDDGLTTWNFLDDYLKVGSDFPILRIPQTAELSTKTVERPAELSLD